MKNAFIFLFFVATASTVNAEEIFLICDVEGAGNGWGPTYIPRPGTDLKSAIPIKEKINMKVLTTVFFESNQPVAMSIVPQCASERRTLFSCNSITSSKSDFQVLSDEISFSKNFPRDISHWRQSVSLNRVTLHLRVSANRRYMNPPDEGWEVSYEGSCSIEKRKL